MRIELPGCYPILVAPNGVSILRSDQRNDLMTERLPGSSIHWFPGHGLVIHKALGIGPETMPRPIHYRLYFRRLAKLHLRFRMKFRPYRKPAEIMRLSDWAVYFIFSLAHWSKPVPLSTVHP